MVVMAAYNKNKQHEQNINGDNGFDDDDFE